MLIVDFLIFIQLVRFIRRKKRLCVRHQSQGWRENPLFDYDLRSSSIDRARMKKALSLKD